MFTNLAIERGPHFVGVKERNNFLRAPMTQLTTAPISDDPPNWLAFRAIDRAVVFTTDFGRGVDHPKKNKNDAETQFMDGQFCSCWKPNLHCCWWLNHCPHCVDCWIQYIQSLSPNSPRPWKTLQFDESNLPTANSWHGHGLYMCNSVKSWIMYPYSGMVTNLSIDINIPISSHFNEDSHHGMDDHKDILRPSK